MWDINNNKEITWADISFSLLCFLSKLKASEMKMLRHYNQKTYIPLPWLLAPSLRHSSACIREGCWRLSDEIRMAATWDADCSIRLVRRMVFPPELSEVSLYLVAVTDVCGWRWESTSFCHEAWFYFFIFWYTTRPKNVSSLPSKSICIRFCIWFVDPSTDFS